ncbi:hypothetical protein LTR86_003719 [Recurvomyces mirabilis]|nr:hypothetical protein LTR86_003719 [Recurvomyces mirabilis]
MAVCGSLLALDEADPSKPSFYFTLQALRMHPQATPIYAAQRRWWPPKRLGENVASPHALFYYDGENTERSDADMNNLEPYKEFSLYHDHGVFWLYPGDASAEQVGDGRDGHGRLPPTSADANSDVDTEEDNPDWAMLNFELLPSRSSYASTNTRQRRLPLRRRHQLWPDQLLPDPHQVEAEAASYTSNPEHGGLNGELPVLLGLMAMALPQQHMFAMLPSCIVNPWLVPHLPRGTGWQDKRGVIISVYYDRTETSEEALRSYEEGEGGSILP